MTHLIFRAMFPFFALIAAGAASVAQAAGPGLGEERIPADEAQATEEIRQDIESAVEREFRESKDGIARRDAHAKHHGCVRATFRVADDLPEWFRAGVLAAPGKAFPAWIRFSNGASRPQKDSAGDGRGMAIKLMDVPGEKILEEEKDARTQDFLMINHPTFFVANASDYVGLIDSVTKHGSPLRFFFPSALPWKWNLRELWAGALLSLKRVVDPLVIRYWSMTPYRLGAAGKAVKFSARPCEGPSRDSKYAFPSKDRDRLRKAMAAHLAAEPACYDFLMQAQTDAKAMPIEDPMRKWSEKRSPFVRVARIEIPKQAFDTPARQDFCEQLSFTPWHSLPEHRPLGGVNRVRKTVYQAVSKLRHRLNGRERREPAPGDRIE